MRIDGKWQRDPDKPEIVRPLVSARLPGAGAVRPIWLLVDTGADRTVLGSSFAKILEPYRRSTSEAFLSAGGELESFIAEARIVLTSTTGRDIGFNVARCIVLTNPAQANTHLLGRDVLNLFAVILDRERDLVTLLRPPHTYRLTP